MCSMENGGATPTVTSGFIRLNRHFFDEGKLVINKHKLSLTEQISYPTILRYLAREGETDYDIRTFSGDVLFAILTKGMGYSQEELEGLTLGEVFEFVQNGMAQ